MAAIRAHAWGSLDADARLHGGVCYTRVMSTLSFSRIGLQPRDARAAARRAREEGKTPSEYLRALVERDLLAADSFDEVLRPARAAFAKGPASEAKLDAVVKAARRDLHKPQRRKGRA